MSQETEIYCPVNNIRIITATSLFDGHDAAINIMRRILQDTGVEVIHLGHNRSVKEVVEAAVEEDVQGIAVSSYQGGHMEYFKYIIDLLKEKKVSHIKVFGGGGGVIVSDEIKELETYGVTKIYSPEDGTTMGLQGMMNDVVRKCDFSTLTGNYTNIEGLSTDNKQKVASLITAVHQAKENDNGELQEIKEQLSKAIGGKTIPVIGITGTGGAGKSSLTDEVILRFSNDYSRSRIAIISSDPSRRKTGGALLGDRIRMNAIGTADIYMRSLATRGTGSEFPDVLPEAIEVVKAAGFDLIIVETAGIGQGDSSIVDLADVSIYVMTSEFGAPSQLEKIDMLDYADIIVVNKYEKRGSEDAVRDVRKQVQRNRRAFDQSPDEMPVFGTIASKFNDDGVTALYHAILEMVAEKTGISLKSNFPKPETRTSSSKSIIIPAERVRYLSEIAEIIHAYHNQTSEQADALRKLWHLEETLQTFEENKDDEALIERLRKTITDAEETVYEETSNLFKGWEKTRAAYSKDELVYNVRGRDIRLPLFEESLSQIRVPKIALPGFRDPGEIYTWLRKENLPGFFPFTAGLFPLKRVDEDPTRMFAGEGGPSDTNKRFRLLSGDYEAKRLSTAFDSVTLYGCDPEERADIYGKIGTSGVSVCTVDDVRVLYDGFDLCAPNTSVSMTINGPAPIILAMFLNAAIDQQVELYRKDKGRKPSSEAYDAIRKKVFKNIRGTVQADILKEDQGQNTCIFSVDFALKMMGDIQEFFIEQDIRNFYSVSISGYHIAEAGANPITQLALTLSNGFTYVEYYLSRGMPIDSFAPSLSFFFSSGMDPEYTVMGRVARRIWAIALGKKYGASVRSQMLKYHTQTSGRSLHIQDIQFNDVRTTLQALCAIYDNCNSLHTNAYDEAITTPTDESVRRALAIQLIINREWGLTKNENMNQGSFILEELTDLVEEAVLTEFHRISERGGVLGAMETGFQRGRIQDESILYEKLKHTGKLPLVGVNTFRDPNADLENVVSCLELSRADDEQKKTQLSRLEAFCEKNKADAPEALVNLKNAVLSGDNIFAELMTTVRLCSLGEITRALYDVGGQYRRSV